MSVEILIGDCRETLKTLPDESVQCCVTSPPYFGLRDYGHAGQIGLEPTPAEFVAQMVAVFREVRRVLANDGTMWLNLGDSYTPVNRGENARPRRETLTGISAGNPHSDLPTKKEMIQGIAAQGFKSKDLVRRQRHNRHGRARTRTEGNPLRTQPAICGTRAATLQRHTGIAAVKTTPDFWTYMTLGASVYYKIQCSGRDLNPPDAIF
jgi:hypothetical protein